MPDLSTTYMGLSLRNPVIVGSSNLTSKPDEIAACEEAGAGAVVLKSLFEEQIVADSQGTAPEAEYLAHAEAFDFFKEMGKSYYLDAYLKLVKEAKARISIPVIASVNAITDGAWIEYARSFEDVGADALELNCFIMPGDVKKEGSEMEQRYVDIVRKIKAKVGLPVSIKIGPYFSSPANMIKRLGEEGLDAVVLFNRFYRPDVDIESFKITAGQVFSNATEISQSLQWIAMLSGEIGIDMGASTGIHDAVGAIKQLLVGAKTVQMCSTLYRNGIGFVKKVVSGIEEWMNRHEYNTLADFNGKLCQEESEHPEVYERTQFIKALVGIS